MKQLYHFRKRTNQMNQSYIRTVQFYTWLNVWRLFISYIWTQNDTVFIPDQGIWNTFSWGRWSYQTLAKYMMTQFLSFKKWSIISTISILCSNQTNYVIFNVGRSNKKTNLCSYSKFVLKEGKWKKFFGFYDELSRKKGKTRIISKG